MSTRMTAFIKKVVVFVALFVFLVPGVTFSQSHVKEDKSLEKIGYLESLQKKLKWIEQEAERKQKNLALESTSALKLEIENEIVTLKRNAKKTEQNFQEVATDLLLTKVHEQGSKDRNLIKELQEVLAPGLTLFRRISARPRSIEKLRYEIAEAAEKIDQLTTGLENLKLLASLKQATPLKENLKRTREKINRLLEEQRIVFAGKERTLQTLLSQEKPVLVSLSEVAVSFINNRGKNLFFAVITFVLVFWFFSLLRGKIIRSHFLPETARWAEKPLKALYGVLSIVFAVSASLLCLYVLNDWMLATFVLIALILLLWSTRQWVPGVLHETRLILNLGTVKEGERIIWNGLSWLVQDLGFHSILVNEQLDGGRQRVSASSLLHLNSRPVVQGEPWFPTSTGDWVLLCDNTFGQVLLQSMEQVVLGLEGGTRKFYRTSHFISLTPINLSDGFRIEIVFGLDYSIQGRICTEIPELFHKELTEKFHHRLSEPDPTLTNLCVEVHDAGESSLNIWIKVDCVGAIGGLYCSIKREIQKELIAICNSNRLTIPFNQLTLHGWKGVESEG